MVARIRTIKPNFFRSHDVAELSYRARLTWVGLWTYVDDEGRGRDDARIIKGDLWALEDKVTWQEVERDLTELSRSAHVVRYTVNGRAYLAIPKWLDHQAISRPTKSKFPPPNPVSDRDAAPITEDSLSTHGANTAGTGNREQGTGNREGEQGTSPTATDRDLIALFDSAYSHWPKKVKRDEALAKFKGACKANKAMEIAVHITRFGDAYKATTDKQFVPALGVWLSGKRWTDDLPTAPQDSSKPTPTDRATATLGLATDIDMREIEQ